MGKMGYNPSLADGKTLADILREVRFREKRKLERGGVNAKKRNK